MLGRQRLWPSIPAGRRTFRSHKQRRPTRLRSSPGWSRQVLGRRQRRTSNPAGRRAFRSHKQRRPARLRASRRWSARLLGMDCGASPRRAFRGHQRRRLPCLRPSLRRLASLLGQHRRRPSVVPRGRAFCSTALSPPDSACGDLPIASALDERFRGTWPRPCPYRTDLRHPPYRPNHGSYLRAVSRKRRVPGGHITRQWRPSRTSSSVRGWMLPPAWLTSMPTTALSP